MPDVVEVTPRLESGAPRLSVEDRMTMENMFLQLQNLSLQVQVLDANREALLLRIDAVKADLAKKHTELSAKYGVDLKQVSVAADGTFHPLQNNGAAHPS